MPSALSRFDIRQAAPKILIAIGVWLALNLVFAFFLVRPRVAEYATLMTDSEPRLQALERRRKQVELQEAFLAELTETRENLTYLRDDVLATRRRRMVEVQMELHRLAEQFNIRMERVQYQNSELEEEQLDRMGMVVPLEGGYQNLRRFVQAVESSDKFLVIEKVALGQGKQGGVLLQMNITLATYFDAPQLRRQAEPAVRRATRN